MIDVIQMNDNEKILYDNSLNYEFLDHIEVSKNDIEPSFDIEEGIISFLKLNRYNFGVTYPCSKLKKVLKLLEKENFLKIVPVTKEEEGVGICAGSFLAGKKPFMIIQSSGLGNSFNAIASLLKT